MRTNFAGSSVASASASVCSFRYSLPSDRKRDVVVLRLDVVDLVDREHVDARTVAHEHASGTAWQRAGPRWRASCTGMRLASAAAARARASSASPSRSATERLQQVVDRVHVERPQRVLVVGRDEHDRHVAADQFEHLEAVELRHLDVEKQQVGMQLGDGLDCLEPVGALGHDLDVGIGVRYSRRTARASASSSTMATRSRSRAVSVIGGTGHGQLDTEAALVRACLEARIGAEHRRAAAGERCRARRRDGLAAGASVSRGFSMAIDS